ncbi:MAG: hypothetical protein K0R54_688 [Clostridiaceae bacterium]|jgi:hypothetical protein|nr:hypothetical protein [Clostridiaceae bacterium]
MGIQLIEILTNNISPPNSNIKQKEKQNHKFSQAKAHVKLHVLLYYTNQGLWRLLFYLTALQK